jgi:RND superfamily putative drug exporter
VSNDRGRGVSSVLRRIVGAASAAPRRVIAGAALIMVACALLGVPVTKELSAGGFTDPASESARTADILADKFDQTYVQLMVTVTSTDGAQSPAATATAADIINVLKRSPDVLGVVSTWTAPPAAVQALTSTDGKTGVMIAGLRGDDADYGRIARVLVEQFPPARVGVVVRGGGALTYAETQEQTERDLILAESVAIPLSFIALVWVFGGLFAAALPLAIGLFSILGSLAVLRAVTVFTDVSIFALNLTVALALALAVDYSLLIVSRYRDEIADGETPDGALVRALATAGSTTAAVVITPAAIAILGPRLDALDIRPVIRRALGRPLDATRPPVERLFFYRTTHFVTRHAIPISLSVIALLMLLGAPFLGVKSGFPDDRVLPNSASSRQVGDLLRDQFAVSPVNDVTIVVPGVAPGGPGDGLAAYAARLSQVADVAAVASPSGTYVHGALAGPPAAPTGLAGGSAYLTAQSRAPLFSDASTAQLQALHEVPGPDGQPVLFAGFAQTGDDTITSITSRLPAVLGLIAAITIVLMFLITGSVVLPLKALVLNILSLCASFGALVWVFQDGNLAGLGTTATGALVPNLLVLMFCVCFGLSMDYEVFLLSRIHEFWLASNRGPADNVESVALGLARTGRVVTAAAVLMSISFAALITAHVSFVKMLGVGLAIAVLIDATVVRMLLLPALMRLLGRANWWAPEWLARLHARIGLAEGAVTRPASQTTSRHE